MLATRLVFFNEIRPCIKPHTKLNEIRVMPVSNLTSKELARIGDIETNSIIQNEIRCDYSLRVIMRLGQRGLVGSD